MRVGLLLLLLFLPTFLHAAPIEPTLVYSPYWMVRHLGFLRSDPTAKVVFLGDSITDFWSQQGREVWNSQIVPLKALNFGIGGDRIENVHWRVLNGELEHLTPQVIVLLIGTNNLRTHTADEIGNGYRLLVEEIRRRSPNAKLVLLSLFPRVDPGSADYRFKLPLVNQKITQLAKEYAAKDAPVLHLDLGSDFLAEDGTLSQDVAFDGLHLSKKGYEIWAKALVPVLVQLLH